MKMYKTKIYKRKDVYLNKYVHNQICYMIYYCMYFFISIVLLMKVNKNFLSNKLN